MKIALAGAAAVLAFTLSACSAGVSVGSATYHADERGETLCTRSYGASVDAPDTQHSGLHRRGGCVRRDDTEDE